MFDFIAHYNLAVTEAPSNKLPL